MIVPKRKYNPCPVPSCQRAISITSQFGVCSVHDDLFQGITYYLKQAQKEVNQTRKAGVRPGERKTPGGLILP